MMHPLYASIYGGIAGLFIGFGIAMFEDMSLLDTLFRLSVLVSGGAVMGGSMAWLENALASLERSHQSNNQSNKQTDTQR